MLPSENAVLYAQQCQLPKRSEMPITKQAYVPFKQNEFPASCSLSNTTQNKSPSEFVFYDGSKNSFTEQASEKPSRKRKLLEIKTQSIPRPTNSFISARSLFQQKLKVICISAGECSNIMSTIWKMQSSKALKHYFQYIAFVEGARHNALYPNYRYQPKKKSRTKSPHIKKTHGESVTPEYNLLKSPSPSSESEESSGFLGYSTSSQNTESPSPSISESFSSDYLSTESLSVYENSFSQFGSVVSHPLTPLLEISDTLKSYDEALSSLAQSEPDIDYISVSGSLEFLVGDVLYDTLCRPFPIQYITPKSLESYSS